MWTCHSVILKLTVIQRVIQRFLSLSLHIQMLGKQNRVLSFFYYYFFIQTDSCVNRTIRDTPVSKCDCQFQTLSVHAVVESNMNMQWTDNQSPSLIAEKNNRQIIIASMNRVQEVFFLFFFWHRVKNPLHLTIFFLPFSSAQTLKRSFVFFFPTHQASTYIFCHIS